MFRNFGHGKVAGLEEVSDLSGPEMHNIFDGCHLCVGMKNSIAQRSADASGRSNLMQGDVLHIVFVHVVHHGLEGLVVYIPVDEIIPVEISAFIDSVHDELPDLKEGFGDLKFIPQSLSLKKKHKFLPNHLHNHPHNANSAKCVDYKVEPAELAALLGDFFDERLVLVTAGFEEGKDVIFYVAHMGITRL